MYLCQTWHVYAGSGGNVDAPERQEWVLLQQAAPNQEALGNPSLPLPAPFPAHTHPALPAGPSGL